MSETLTVELTQDQRDLLLRGLRFVRSSVMLAPRDSDSESAEDRQKRMQQIATLVDQLSGALPAKTTAQV